MGRVSFFCLLTGLSLLPRRVVAEPRLVPALPKATTGAAGQIPAAEMLRDIRGPVTLNNDPGLMLGIGIGAAILFVLLAFLFYRWWKARRNQTIAQLSCWEKVFHELEELKQFQTDEQASLYTERISHLLRNYIEEQFGLKIQARTSAEFLAQLRKSTISGPLRNQQTILTAFLDQTDLIKFARAVAHRTNLLEMERIVRNFVETTRPRPETDK